MAQPWCHQILMGKLSMDVIGLASQIMLQVHLAPKDTQMTVFNATDTFLWELASTWILISGVMGEILKLCEAYEWWKAKTGKWFLCAKAICHPEGFLTAPTACLNCTSAVWHHISEMVPVMENYWAGKSITGGLPEDKLYEAFWKKLPEAGGTFFTPGQTAVLEPFRITRDGLEQGLRKPNGNFQLSLILSWMRIKNRKV